MDLTSFTSEKKEPIKIKKELILNNDEVRIVKIGDEIEFTLKKKEALEKYEKYLFGSTTKSIITDSKDVAIDFFAQSLSDGVEGLMFKNMTSKYTSGLRSGNMAKLKETKEDIDVVILAAEHGKGKRAGFYSSFYVGVKNDLAQEDNDDDLYLNVGKVSSGIKELSENGASLQNLTRLLEPLKLREKNSITFFEPKIIIQVKYQEIQKSTLNNSGYALRFPRIITLREDKSLDEINSLDDISRFSS